jgi:hypothetical protein
LFGAKTTGLNPILILAVKELLGHHDIRTLRADFTRVDL